MAADRGKSRKSRAPVRNLHLAVLMAGLYVWTKAALGDQQTVVLTAAVATTTALVLYRYVATEEAL